MVCDISTFVSPHLWVNRVCRDYDLRTGQIYPDSDLSFQFIGAGKAAQHVVQLEEFYNLLGCGICLQGVVIGLLLAQQVS